MIQAGWNYYALIADCVDSDFISKALCQNFNLATHPDCILYIYLEYGWYKSQLVMTDSYPVNPYLGSNTI